MNGRLHYLGLFSSPVSWAKVNREFVHALDQEGWVVSATALRGLKYDPSFSVPDTVSRAIDRPRDTDLELAMEYPSNLEKLDGEVNGTWVLYETDLPEDWVTAYRNHADFYLCPSRYVYQKALASGLAEENCAVVPFGVNNARYHPTVKPGEFLSDRFVILFVGPPHKRKGLRELLEGYHQVFSDSDDVLLYIKTFESASPDHLYPWEFSLDEHLNRFDEPEAPGIEVDYESRSEEEMASLFASSDIFILPSYGEAFGLSVLESMATGTPVVGTDHGALAEIVTDRNGWLLDGTVNELTEVAYDCEAPREFCVPDTEQIGALLRTLYEFPSLISERKEHAIKTVENWSWTRSARRFEERLTELGVANL